MQDRRTAWPLPRVGEVATPLRSFLDDVDYLLPSAGETNVTVDLYVVSDIKVDTATDPYTASGGTVSRYPDWEPAEEDLRPRKYEYRLPGLTS